MSTASDLHKAVKCIDIALLGATGLEAKERSLVKYYCAGKWLLPQLQSCPLLVICGPATTGKYSTPNTISHFVFLPPIFSARQMTGHSSLEVLRGYVALAESDLKLAHQNFSPVDNLPVRTNYLRRRDGQTY